MSLRSEIKKAVHQLVKAKVKGDRIAAAHAEAELETVLDAVEIMEKESDQHQTSQPTVT